MGPAYRTGHADAHAGEHKKTSIPVRPACHAIAPLARRRIRPIRQGAWFSCGHSHTRQRHFIFHLSSLIIRTTCPPGASIMLKSPAPASAPLHLSSLIFHHSSGSRHEKSGVRKDSALKIPVSRRQYDLVVEIAVATFLDVTAAASSAFAVGNTEETILRQNRLFVRDSITLLHFSCLHKNEY